jgi:hypothetical protein
VNNLACQYVYIIIYRTRDIAVSSTLSRVDLTALRLYRTMAPRILAEASEQREASGMAGVARPGNFTCFSTKEVG